MGQKGDIRPQRIAADEGCTGAACERRNEVDGGLELLEALHTAGYAAEYSSYVWCITQVRTAPTAHCTPGSFTDAH